MSKTKSQKHAARSWWRYSRNRNKVWFPLLAVLAIASISGLAWLASQGKNGGSGATGEEPIPMGQQVQAFQLPDVVSGRQVSLADYIGKQGVVIVGYMGFF